MCVAPGRLGCGNRIGNVISEHALKVFRFVKNTYNVDRFRELRFCGTVPSAEAVVRLFVTQKNKSVSSTAIEATVVQSIDTKLEEAAKISGGTEPTVWVEDSLRDVGPVRRQFDNESCCESGIPGLMECVVEGPANLSVWNN